MFLVLLIEGEFFSSDRTRRSGPLVPTLIVVFQRSVFVFIRLVFIIVRCFLLPVFLLFLLFGVVVKVSGNLGVGLYYCFGPGRNLLVTFFVTINKPPFSFLLFLF